MDLMFGHYCLVATKQEVMKYCAWCKKPERRLQGVFYTSGICKDHLEELKKKTRWHNNFGDSSNVNVRGLASQQESKLQSLQTSTA